LVYKAKSSLGLSCANPRLHPKNEDNFTKKAEVYPNENNLTQKIKTKSTKN